MTSAANGQTSPDTEHEGAWRIHVARTAVLLRCATRSVSPVTMPVASLVGYSYRPRLLSAINQYRSSPKGSGGANRGAGLGQPSIADPTRAPAQKDNTRRGLLDAGSLKTCLAPIARAPSKSRQLDSFACLKLSK